MAAAEVPGTAPIRSPGEALVARLLEVIGGDAPLAEALDLLAPDVVCHMDAYTVCGTDVWFDWLEFIQSRATSELRVDVDRIVTEADGRITAFGWLRTADGRTRQRNQATYRIQGGRIAEVWTNRGNYEMIFGAKVRHRLTWLLVLLEMAVWRRLPWTRRARSSRNREELSDGRRNELRQGGQPDGHPERRRPDRERGRAPRA